MKTGHLGIFCALLLATSLIGCGPQAKKEEILSTQASSSQPSTASNTNNTTNSSTNTPPPAGAPVAPSALSGVAASSAQINLSWKDNSSNETYFKIERAPSGGGPFASADTPGEFYLLTMVNPNVTSFQDLNLLPNTIYYYRVSAVNSVGSSVPTAVFKATTLVAAAAPPAAPTNQVAMASAATIVQLSWNDNSNNETAFVVERSTNGGANFTAVGGGGAGASSFRDINLLPATSYTYRIKAINGAGSSNYTPNVNVTTLVAGNKNTYSYISVNIIEPNCVGCHSGTNPAAGIRYDTYQAVSSGASTMNGSITANRMPPGNGLTADQKASISAWISSGTPNN